MHVKLRSAILMILAAISVVGWSFGEAAWSSDGRRIVAVGDVHGTLPGLTSILRVVGIIDAQGEWTGQDAILVMVGDLIDRGPDDRAVLEFLMALEKKADKQKGAVEVILGNHEAMNLMGDLRYVSKEAYASFVDKNSEKRRQSALKDYAGFLKRRARRLDREDGELSPEGEEKWLEAHPPGYLEQREYFAADSKAGRWLRKRPAVLRLGDILFVHGGLHQSLAIAGEKINRVIESEIRAFDQIRDYMIQKRLILPFFDLGEMTEAATLEVELIKQRVAAGVDLNGIERDDLEVLERFLQYVNWLSFHPDGPLWFRGFASWSDEEGLPHLDRLREVQGVEHFVVGHTPQLPREIKARFGGQVFLIDTGMLASYYEGGGPAALEIQSGRFTAIYPEGRALLWDADVPALAGK